MSDVTREELNGVGVRVNGLEREYEKCKANKDARLFTLERWTQDQEDKLNDISKVQGSLSVTVATMKDEIVGKVSTRMGVMVAAMTLILGILMFLK